MEQTDSKMDMQTCETILEWADTRPNFSQDFVRDLYDRIQKGYALTPKQRQALTNIAERFGIEL